MTENQSLKIRYIKTLDALNKQFAFFYIDVLKYILKRTNHHETEDTIDVCFISIQ